MQIIQVSRDMRTGWMEEEKKVKERDSSCCQATDCIANLGSGMEVQEGVGNEHGQNKRNITL